MKAGSFFLFLLLKRGHAGLLTLGTGEETEHEAMRLAFYHAVHHHFIEGEMFARSCADADQFIQTLEWDGLFSVVRSIRPDKNRLTDGIGRTLHPIK